MILVLVGFLAICAWVAPSMTAATATVVNRPLPVPRWRMRLLAAWAVPLIGGIWRLPAARQVYMTYLLIIVVIDCRTISACESYVKFT